MTLLLDRPTELSNDLTRRGFLAAAAAVSLAACGSQEEASPGAGAAEEEKVTVEHTFGETTISGTPERVVSLGMHEQDFLWALGVQPVAVHTWVGEYPYAAGPWTEGYRKSEPEVLKPWDVNVEWAAAQRPDLIVVTYQEINKATYDKLSAIAPVVAHPAGHKLWEAPWRTELDLIARALRKEKEAAQVLAGLEDTIASIRAKYPQFEGKTFNSFVPEEDQFTVYSAKEQSNALFSSLGFTVPDKHLAKYADGVYIVLSYERMDLVEDLDAAMLFAYPEDLKFLDKNARFQASRLVEEGRLVKVDADVVNAMSMNSPLSIPYFLEIVAPKLAAALDGDPATTA